MFQSFVFISLSFIFCLQTPAQELVSLLLFRLLAAAFQKTKNKMGGNMQQPEKKQIKGDRRGGTAARDVSVLITQQRLALNLHRSGGSYEKRII